MLLYKDLKIDRKSNKKSWCPTTAPLYVTYVVFDRYITISPNCHIPHLFDRVVIDRNDEATDTCATHPDNWLLQL